MSLNYVSDLSQEALLELISDSVFDLFLSELKEKLSLQVFKELEAEKLIHLSFCETDKN